MGKTLTKAELAEMRMLSEKGATPEDLMNLYGVAISTVHYHKRKWKNAGIFIPNVRGHRPQGTASLNHLKHTDLTAAPSLFKPNASESIHCRLELQVNGTTLVLSSKLRGFTISEEAISLQKL